MAEPRHPVVRIIVIRYDKCHSGTVQPREFAARVVAYVLVLPVSLLMKLGVFRVIGGLKNAEHRALQEPANKT